MRWLAPTESKQTSPNRRRSKLRVMALPVLGSNPSSCVETRTMQRRKEKKKPTANASPRTPVCLYSAVSVNAISVLTMPHNMIPSVQSPSVRIHIRNSLAACRRQVAHVRDDRPELIVAQSPLRARHAGRPDAVIEDPFQLPVGEALNVG